MQTTLLFRKSTLISILTFLMLLNFGWARQNNSQTISLTLHTIENVGTDAPVYANIELPNQFADIEPQDISVVVYQPGKADLKTVGQIVQNENRQYQLWWILGNEQIASSGWKADLSIQDRAESKTFSWTDKQGEYLDLFFDGKAVTRYMYQSDVSNSQRAYETYKVYHHVFDERGQDFITKGPGGLYTHQRGIAVGWNHLRYDENKQNDWWHMREGVRQEHQEFVELISGPVLARSSAMIHWNDADGEPVLIEKRTITAYRQGEATIALLDFESTLSPVRGDVYLGGDPEHAGVHFRASNHVAEHTKEQTRYLFKTDKTDPTQDKDIPWAVMSFVIDGQDYSVQQMNNPANPQGTLYSAYRDYARFGAFFVRGIDHNDELTIRYRFWVTKESMPDREIASEKWNAFTQN